jgi:hypothetical protein
MTNWITVEDSLKGRQRAVELERERIIKLLKEQCCNCDSDNCKGWFLPDAESLIALIKGEPNG